jgi:GNAT superfamily N-acetyltransferase
VPVLPSPTRVAELHRTAGLKFVDERSPRLPGARRFKITDPDAEPPGRRDTLFVEKLRHYSDRAPYKRLKRPVMDTPGVTDPGDIAYIDYGGGGGDVYIHLAIVRPGRRGQGLASKLLRAFYKKQFPSGSGAARWGRVLNPAAWALFEKMKREYPEVVHLGSKFF